jgi:hypothetical protein
MKSQSNSARSAGRAKRAQRWGRRSAAPGYPPEAAFGANPNVSTQADGITVPPAFNPVEEHRKTGRGATSRKETSPILRRTYRTRQQMQAFLDAINAILDREEGKITVRHLFYRLVGQSLIQKTELAYKGLCSHLSKWRKSGDIRWSAFADNTRWHIQHRTFDSVQEALENCAKSYRRDLWSTQDSYLECWVEKDAIASIVAGVANSFGVPVFVCRGFASLSSLYAAAGTFRAAVEAGKKPIIYHLGDHDPSGVAAGESVLRSFRDDFAVDLQFVRAAVTRQQIEEFDLPTRPVKTSDTRAAKWTGGQCVELDSMRPADIRRIVEQSITRHIEPRAWEIARIAEEDERQKLRKIFGRAA